jgi:hypothetical protein
MARASMRMHLSNSSERLRRASAEAPPVENAANEETADR